MSTAQAGHTAAEWKDKVIYQIITDRFWRDDNSTSPCNDLHAYCGGTWNGIKNNLDYIKGMGFTAIWISPIPENMGNDYHGYAALDWNKVNSHFGSEQDLKDLVSSAHEKGIWVMLDVVANHVAPVDEDYSKVTPFNDASMYHSKCQIDNWNDPGNVEYCRLANLPDLNQDNEFVRSTLKTWVKDTIDKFNFDGLRVDTVPEVKHEFWKEYNDAAGVYTVGEVFNGDIGLIASYQGSLDALLNYPLYFTMKDVFSSSNSMYGLRNLFTSEEGSFSDTSLLGNFIDNHDNERFLHSTGVPQMRAALTFALSANGIPIMYYGTEQYFNGGNDPDDREPLWPSKLAHTEMYDWVATINAARESTGWWKVKQVERWCDENFFAFTRGNVLMAFSNSFGSDQSRTINYHDFSVGAELVNIFDSNDKVTVENDGIHVTINNGQPKIYKVVTGYDTLLQK